MILTAKAAQLQQREDSPYLPAGNVSAAGWYPGTKDFIGNFWDIFGIWCQMWILNLIQKGLDLLRDTLPPLVDAAPGQGTGRDFRIISAKIDNSSPLEPQAQEQESNPEPGSPWAARPMDCRTACPHFSGIKPLQADAEDDGPYSGTDHTKEIIAPSGMPITAPNGGAKAATISFIV
ncbi:hypothetical protein DSO57_1001465 [Entomophthora muscae]|uniref:Uncharacterized protein n=1 Tax=Entomophthora muscae TaxID=34485 RepID=A0ACC2UIF0_9FUNG|nr:hypothetical protein DSO57_1001465 [Entomophthora muscae]